jgi:hypothetical protein
MFNKKFINIKKRCVDWSNNNNITTIIIINILLNQVKVQPKISECYRTIITNLAEKRTKFYT